MKCPTCKKDTFYEENPFRPFCSPRCKLIDLGKWASGDYKLPSTESAWEIDEFDGRTQDDP